MPGNLKAGSLGIVGVKKKKGMLGGLFLFTTFAYNSTHAT
jgi:hypothetical protein